jgi:hypothetical protein
MLDKKQFLKGLKYLNDYYVNFKFDINDNAKLGIWFSVFETLDDDTFTNLIKSYCKDNIYAPQSPTHLLEHAKKRVLQYAMGEDEAWGYALDMLRSVGYTMSRFYAKCEHPIIAKAIKSMESDFYNLYTEQLPFVKKTFVKLYKEYLVNNVEENIRKNQFSLANEEQIAIDYKGGTNDTD